jgi:sugar lactone lactonase YvrE
LVVRSFSAAILILAASCCAFGQSAVGYTIQTVAGNGTAGYAGDGGPAVAAELSDPFGGAVDSAGNLYIADWGNARIRKVSNGTVTTVAGNGTEGYGGDNGPATSAELSYPIGVAVDSAGNLYVADTYNQRIRKISNGVITTVAGVGTAGFSGDNGAATSAQLNYPYGVAVDSSGNLYIADYGNNRIRKVSNGVITTVAGTGTAGFAGDGGLAVSAQVNQPISVAVDSSGRLYIADYGNDRIRGVSSGIIATVAGNGTPGFAGDGGPATGAQLYSPRGVAVDSGGNLYIADTYNQRIREVTSGVIFTIAGNGTPGYSGDGATASSAELYDPTGVAIGSGSNVYIADLANSRIRVLIPSGPPCTTSVSPLTIAPGAPGGTFNLAVTTSAPVCYWAVQTLPSWITNAGNNIGTGSATVTLVVASNSAGARSAAISIAGSLVQVNQSSPPCNYSLSVGGEAFPVAGGTGSVSVTAQSYCSWSASSPVSWVTVKSGAGGAGNGTVTFQVAANSGSAQSATLTIAGIPFTVDEAAGTVLSQTYNIGTFAGNGTVGYAGDGGPPASAEVSQPLAAAVDSAGNLYFADKNNQRVRKISHGTITTVAGNGAQGYAGDGGPAIAAQLSWPSGVALDAAGNLYIADAGNNVVRKVSNGTITTVAGNASYGYTGDGGPATGAQLNYPSGVAVDGAGNLYIADSDNNAVRKVSNGIITTAAGTGTEGYIGDGGVATSAELAYPEGVAVDSLGNVYIADSLNYAVRWITNGVINTLAGNGTQGYGGDGGPGAAAQLNIPVGVAVDPAGNLYIADTGNNRVRELSSAVISTLAGNGTQGFSGDGGAAKSAELAQPSGVAVDSSGNVYIVDTANSRIRVATPTSSTCNAAVNPVALFPPTAGGNFPLTIATGASCSWAVQNLPSWITVSGSATGSGVAQITLVVAANAGGARTATIAVAGISVPVSQGAAPCSFALSYGGQGFPASGGTGSVGVIASSWCSWSVSNPLSWVTVTSATSGQGNGTVAYQVAANSGPAQSGGLTIAGLAYTVEEASAAAGGLAAAGSLAQITSGGAWNTTITLVNTGSAPAEVELNFFGANGNALALPLAFPQSSFLTAAAPLVASTLDQTIAAGAEMIVQTAGTSSQANAQGWAQLLSNGTVSGSAVYAETTATGTEEAVVPLETRNPAAFVLPFDYAGGYQTGVALVNLTAQAVSVPVTLRNAAGASLGTASIPLQAHAQTAFMLASNYPAVAGQYGAMELDTPPGAQIAALGIRAAPDGAITTVPVVAAGAASNGSLAQVASGGPWNTTFTLVNTGSAAAQVTLNFYGDNGTPAQLPLTFPLSGSAAAQPTTTLSQTIAPEAQLVIATAGTSSQATTEGWAQLQVTGGNVGGSAVFDDATAAGVQEAIVPVQTAGSRAYVLPFDYTGGRQTGVALANLTNLPVTVSVTLRDSTGAGLASAAPIQLQPFAHTSFMLASQYPAVSGLYGTIELDTPSVGQIGALGIRATPGGAITSVPALAK